MNPSSVDPVTCLADQARSRLVGATHKPFSPEGFDALQERVEEYIGDLIVESVRIMERRQADTVSRRYVLQASENLAASSRRRKFALIGTIGGALFGTALTSYYTMVSAAKGASIPEILVAAVFGGLGMLMIGVQYSRE